MENIHENEQLKALWRQKCLKNGDIFWPSASLKTVHSPWADSHLHWRGQRGSKPGTRDHCSNPSQTQSQAASLVTGGTTLSSCEINHLLCKNLIWVLWALSLPSARSGFYRGKAKKEERQQSHLVKEYI